MVQPKSDWTSLLYILLFKFGWYHVCTGIYWFKETVEALHSDNDKALAFSCLFYIYMLWNSNTNKCFLAKLLNEGIPIRIYKKLKHFYFQIFFVLINLFSENHFLYYFFPLVVIVSLIIMTYNTFEWMCVVLQIQIPFQPPQCPKVPTAV